MQLASICGFANVKVGGNHILCKSTSVCYQYVQLKIISLKGL